MVCSWPADSNSFWDKRGGHGVWKLAKGLGIAGSCLKAPGEKAEKLSPADLGRVEELEGILEGEG